MRDYASLPFETRELYKKYVVQLDVPAKSGGAAGMESQSVELCKAIEDSSRIKFDLVNDQATPNNRFVSVRETKPGNNGSGGNGSMEEKLASFVRHASNGVVEVDVPDGETARINLMFIYDNRNTPSEIMVRTGENSKLSLFEWHASVSSERTMAAPVHSISIGKKSEAEINILHNENYNTIVGALNRSSVGEMGRLNFNTIYNGSAATKSTSYASAAGMDSAININEIVFGNSDQKFDVGSFVLNGNEGTRAIIRSGAVLKDKAFCILKGYAKVASNAVGAYSNVEEKGVVLDPDARIQPLPDMSIDCKDVVFASHSAATAPIDKEALFYLMSRGLEEPRAKRIFVASFISKYIASVNNNIVKEIAMSIMLDKLDNNTLAHVPKITPQNIWIVPAKK